MTSEEIIKDLKARFDEDEFFNTEPEYMLVHTSGWDADCKMQHQNNVLKHIESGVFIQVTQTRSGSHFTDYNYEENTYDIVEPYEVTSTSYRKIRKT